MLLESGDIKLFGTLQKECGDRPSTPVSRHDWCEDVEDLRIYTRSEWTFPRHVNIYIFSEINELTGCRDGVSKRGVMCKVRTYLILACPLMPLVVPFAVTILDFRGAEQRMPMVVEEGVVSKAKSIQLSYAFFGPHGPVRVPAGAGRPGRV